MFHAHFAASLFVLGFTIFDPTFCCLIIRRGCDPNTFAPDGRKLKQDKDEMIEQGDLLEYEIKQDFGSLTTR